MHKEINEFSLVCLMNIVSVSYSKSKTYETEAAAVKEGKAEGLNEHKKSQ